jgi:hypothetical protein
MRKATILAVLLLFLAVAVTSAQDLLLYVGFENTDIGQGNQEATTTGPVVYGAGYSGQARQMAAAGTNLVLNPSYEGNLNTWVRTGFDTTEIITGGVSGTDALRAYDASYGGNQVIHVTDANRPAVTPGLDYTLSVSIKKLKCAGTGSIAIAWFDSGGTLIGSVEVSVLQSGTHDWHRYSMNRVAPTGAASARYYAFRSTGITAATEFEILFDAVQFEQSAYPTPYADGSHPAATMSYDNPVQPLNGSSLSLWWNPAADHTGPTRYLFDEGSLEGYFNSSDDKIYLSDGSNTIATPALTFNANTWQHLVFNWSTWDGLQIVRDGALVASGTAYTPPAPGPALYIGSDTSGNNQADGLIDELEITDQQSSHTMALDSGKSVLIPLQVTFGHTIIAGLLLAVIAAEGLYLIYGVAFKR